MGDTISRAVQPEPLAVFKRISGGPSAQAETSIPELSENRKLTDLPFLIAFFVTVIVLISFLIYIGIHSDVNRLKRGYDECGNVCGQKNHYYADYECSGKDFTWKKYLQYDSDIKPGNIGHLITPRRCVAKCDSGYEPREFECRKVDSENRTQTEESMDKQTKYLIHNGGKTAIAGFFSLGLVILMFFLIKIATTVVVWISLGVSLISCGFFVGFSWFGYTQDTQKLNLIFAIVFSVIWLIMCFIMVFCFKRIRLVLQLFKEASKAISDMLFLIFLPLLLILAIILIILAWIITWYFIESFGILKPLQDDYLYYEVTDILYFTLVLNVFTSFWAIQLISGIQYMVVAGAVVKWYFSRNNLGEPILRSTSIVFKFHLGSIAFGSLLIFVVCIIRLLFEMLAEIKHGKACIDSCMPKVEAFFKSLSKNSYIMTVSAMHGQPFYKSGKRAAKIIFANLLSIFTIKFVGCFVLVMIQVGIVCFSLFFTAALLKGDINEQAAPVYRIVLIVSLLAVLGILSVLGTTVDTIILCFCEDSLMNDGMARPYAMSTNLSEFVEKWKTSFGVRE